ncbi:transcriptional regulatory protein GAL4 [Pochonia chlamydosporia 170]|uniref:Transcriptional regulatory protein GAL4 n=1 Tax=Pochonia chlamydosporia 170 TaxID=1380566 RepID=A0A179EYT9_METCM|nr:transcriptional regulatory protein GAL4 [Pochonia chlamydosporia 170]OAQ58338.1 transcriptional regulatory protein GAL4 [Pochonia chlamydosporia 170]
MRRGRVRSACVRCRRQKLKCDPSLPCQLCIRSGVQCVSSTDILPSPTKPSKPCSNALDFYSSTPVAGKRKADVPRQSNVKTQRTQQSADSVQQVEYVSVVRLVEQILASTNKGIWVDSPLHQAVLPRRQDRYAQDASRKSIQDILGEEMPPQEICDILVASYMHAVQWYFPLVYEPSFQPRLNSLLREKTCSLADQPFLMLSLAAMLLGLYFATPQDLKNIIRIPPGDISCLRAQMTSVLEKNFLGSFEQHNLDWICFSSLLALYNVLNRRTRRGTMLIASAIQAAKDLKLDKATNSASVTVGENEMRKRVWWTLFAADGFVGLSAGRAPMARLEEITVTESLDSDNSMRSPEFQSMEVRDDGSLQPVTTCSFQRYRARLFRVAARLNTKRYTSQHPYKNGSFKDETRDIYNELERWRESLPPELCLDSYTELEAFNERENTAGQIFRVQALTLKLLYENIQVLLFWPFIKSCREADGPVTRRAAQAATSSTGENDLASFARAHCFQSAMRFARIGQYESILHMSYKTPVVIPLAASSMTFGAILGMLALLNPTSASVRDYKICLASIVKLPKMCNFKNVLCEQATEILQGILRLICSEEADSLLAGDLPPPMQFADDAASKRGSAQDMGLEGVEQGGMVDTGMFSGSDTSDFVYVDILADCYTTLANLYGLNLDLENLG